jgi:uncharacterized protein with HEPN domain
MPKDNSLYVDHMLECIERIEEYTIDKEQFTRSRLVQDAVIRNLQVLAESSQRLSEATKKQIPEIPWRSISGFRNILVHDYLGVDLELNWSVVEMELPNLQRALRKLQNQQI